MSRQKMKVFFFGSIVSLAMLLALPADARPGTWNKAANSRLTRVANSNRGVTVMQSKNALNVGTYYHGARSIVITKPVLGGLVNRRIGFAEARLRLIKGKPVKLTPRVKLYGNNIPSAGERYTLVGLGKFAKGALQGDEWSRLKKNGPSATVRSTKQLVTWYDQFGGPYLQSGN